MSRVMVFEITDVRSMLACSGFISAQYLEYERDRYKIWYCSIVHLFMRHGTVPMACIYPMNVGGHVWFYWEGAIGISHSHSLGSYLNRSYIKRCMQGTEQKIRQEKSKADDALNLERDLSSAWTSRGIRVVVS